MMGFNPSLSASFGKKNCWLKPNKFPTYFLLGKIAKTTNMSQLLKMSFTTFTAVLATYEFPEAWGRWVSNTSQAATAVYCLSVCLRLRWVRTENPFIPFLMSIQQLRCPTRHNETQWQGNTIKTRLRVQHVLRPECSGLGSMLLQKRPKKSLKKACYALYLKALRFIMFSFTLIFHYYSEYYNIQILILVIQTGNVPVNTCGISSYAMHSLPVYVQLCVL